MDELADLIELFWGMFVNFLRFVFAIFRIIEDLDIPLPERRRRREDDSDKVQKVLKSVN